jgi:hypothetical protein
MSSYIKERYINDDKSSEYAFEYLTYLNEEGFKVVEHEVGFIVYKFQGDACIVNDIYTRQEHRKTKGAWKLFNELRKLTIANTNCNVLIGFSEFYGQGHEDGKGAMKAAGFVKAGEDNMREIYMRGNY